MNTDLVRTWGSSETISENKTIAGRSAEETTGYLALEFGLWKNLFLAQTPSNRDFLEGEASKLAEALVQNKPKVGFLLPENITVPMFNSTIQESHTVPVPPALRKQRVGGSLKRLAGKSLIDILRERLGELESYIDPSIIASAGLIRYSVAIHLAHRMLPNGNRVVYLTIPGDEIPTIPVINEGQGTFEQDALRFFLPQWVSFDNQDRLLVNSFHEAEVSLASMKRYLLILNMAISFAPYLVVDPEYQEKRYGILGQIINQGRAMARYQTKEIIQIIKQRERANCLNRGLNLDMTYFNDISLELENRNIEVIPAGRILFHPAFVILAARKERAKISQDLNMSYSTRKHFQVELLDLERAFETAEYKNEPQV